MVGGTKPGDRLAKPAHRGIARQRQIGIAGGMQPRRTRLELERERLLAGVLDRLGVRTVGTLVEREPESRQLPDMMTLDEHVAIHTDFRFQHRILSHRFMSTDVLRSTKRFVNRSCSASDSRSSISRVFSCSVSDRQAIRACWTHRSRSGSGQSAPTACRSRRPSVGPTDLFGHEILVDRAMPDEIEIDRGDQIGMLGRRDPPVIGQCAGLPQGLHARRIGGQIDDLGIAGEMIERLLVDRRQGTCQPGEIGNGVEARLERVDRAKV